MKRLLVLILAAIIFIGCSKKEKSEDKNISSTPDTSGVLKTTKDDSAPKDVSISYQLKKDKQYTFRLTSISNTSQSIISDSTAKQSISQTVSYIFDFNVNEIESDNVMDLKVNIKSVKLDASANGKKISYQSGSKLNEQDKLKFIEYEAVVNSPFSARVDSKGEILEIYKVDKIALKFLTMQGLKDSVTQEQKKQFQTNIAETALKPLLQQIFRTLPKKNISKDSLWSNSYSTHIGVFDINNTAKYKLKDFAKLNNDRVAIIEAGLEISSKGKEKVSDKGVNYSFKKPEATGGGTIYFNLNKGCIEKSKTKTTLKMSMTMSVAKSPRGPMKATRNDYIENTNILELL